MIWGLRRKIGGSPPKWVKMGPKLKSWLRLWLRWSRSAGRSRASAGVGRGSFGGRVAASSVGAPLHSRRAGLRTDGDVRGHDARGTDGRPEPWESPSAATKSDSPTGPRSVSFQVRRWGGGQGQPPWYFAWGGGDRHPNTPKSHTLPKFFDLFTPMNISLYKASFPCTCAATTCISRRGHRFHSPRKTVGARGGYRIWRRGGPDFQPRSCEEELFFAVFCDMREPI